ncbi:MAG: acyl-CoA thioesterase II [Desulfobacterales bacterium]|nr:acyl-CoA thioesterase II [Desulfobacterales bacterium]
MTICDQGLALKNLIRLLRLEQTQENHFIGQSQDLGFGNVFGGQVLGQALSAATQTAGMALGVHSLHAYFLRAGNPAKPIHYRVERIRDGKSFATRRIVAAQDGEEILFMSCSFQREEAGFTHQDPMPENIPGPGGIESETDIIQRLAQHIPSPAREKLLTAKPIDIRPVNPTDHLNPQPGPPEKYIWFKAASPLPKDENLHKALLAYASDFNLVDTALCPHAKSFWSPDMQVASLDHSIWFHREFSMDDWLLYILRSPTASGARGLNIGAIYTRDGVRVASVAQEGLIRHRPRP